MTRADYFFLLHAGPKELPRVARTLGRLTGRATGALYKARAQVTQIAERAELDKVRASS